MPKPFVLRHMAKTELPEYFHYIYSSYMYTRTSWTGWRMPVRAPLWSRCCIFCLRSSRTPPVAISRCSRSTTYRGASGCICPTSPPSCASRTTTGSSSPICWSPVVTSSTISGSPAPSTVIGESPRSVLSTVFIRITRTSMVATSTWNKCFKAP